MIEDDPRPGQDEGMRLPPQRPSGAAVPGVFLDRDGTVCEEVGYVNHLSRCQILPRSAEAIRLLNEAGLPVAIVTNQAGVARGYFREEMIESVNERVRSLLGERGARVEGIYYCPHHPSAGAPPYRTECDCRKPKPGLLLRAAREIGIDLQSSFLVGDSSRDIEAGRSAGVTSVLVLTGYGRGEWEHQRERFPVPPAHIAEDLLEAVHWILKQRRHDG
jgi:D-glycero-D-manno-heptose 1,7-bisphosphate phosphatase